jgi:hypothetical protein
MITVTKIVVLGWVGDGELTFFSVVLLLLLCSQPRERQALLQAPLSLHLMDFAAS